MIFKITTQTKKQCKFIMILHKLFQKRLLKE